MNPDKPTTGGVSESFKVNLQREAGLLEATHESEHALLFEAAKVLRQEEEMEKHQELFDEAMQLHLEIEELLSELLKEDVAHSFVSYHEKALEQAREKNIKFGSIKNEIVKILESLGYGEAEVEDVDQADENTTPAEEPVSLVSKEVPSVESETIPQPEITEEAATIEASEKNQSEIEKLTELYKTANDEVFRAKNLEGGKQTKPFQVINDEIKNVLNSAGFNQDMVMVFMNETVNRFRHEIKELSQKKAAESSRSEGQKIGVEIRQKYKDLLASVASFMQTEKVDEAEGLVDGELPTEGLDNLDDAIESALKEFSVLEQSGAYTDDDTAFKKASVAAGRLLSYTEADAVRASHDKERYLRKLQAALVELKGQIGDIAPDVAFEESSAAEVDSIEPLVADEVVKEVGQQPLPDAATVAPESVPEEKYENKYEGHFEAKKNFKVKDREYKESLKAYYEDKNKDATWRAKFRNGLEDAQKVFGINPELPPALQAMKDESRRLRSLYVGSLVEALKERGEREGNKEFYIENDQTKVAFGRKFILAPNQEILALQERNVLSPEVKARLNRVMQTMAKHKWATRIGIVTAAGVAAGLTGGAVLAGAGFQASKMAISAALGAGAGYRANRIMQTKVDNASQAFDKKSKEFNLANLDVFETELLKAQSDIKSAKTRQKVATIGAAVIAGGAAGFSLSSVDVDGYLPQSREGLSKEAVGRIVSDEIAASEVVEQSVPTVEPVPVVVEPTVAVEKNVEVVPEKIDGINIERFTIPFYGNSGERLFETVISDIKIEGSFAAGELTAETRLALEKHIKLSMDDALHAHPYIPEEKLEADVLAKVQAKFGTAPWFADAGITKIDIKGMSLEEYFPRATAPALDIAEHPIPGGNKIEVGIGSSDNVYTEAAPVRNEVAVSVERGPSTYVVQKGDTLSEITEKRFAEQLKDIPVEKRGVLLDELFRNIQADADLRNSLGIRSGDIDLIYANEKLNLDGVEAELTRLVEREQILENFRTSGPLSVEADAEVKNVPITVVEKPVPASVEVTADSGRVYKEAVPVTVEKTVELVAPRPFALNGQYAEHPTYKEYINKAFGSMKTFEVAVEKSVQNFDNNTYDIFERPGFFGGENYESPYRFLGEMSLQEVTEFETQPNEKIRSFMQENKIKYDTYLAWLDQIDLMVKTLPNQADTTVADLFARYVAETQVPKVNPLIKTP